LIFSEKEEERKIIIINSLKHVGLGRRKLKTLGLK
jgi:hypothetical protein